MMDRLKTFKHGGKELELRFVEEMQVKEGVVCDVYEFINDNTRDLGIVRVSAGARTPKQKILDGDKTIEGFIGGEGILKVTNAKGQDTDYMFPGSVKEVELHKGDIMQWNAETDLTFYEICYPAYKDGRFENLD